MKATLPHNYLNTNKEQLVSTSLQMRTTTLSSTEMICIEQLPLSV